MSTPSLHELTIPLRVALNAPRGLLVVPLWFVAWDGRYWCASQANSVLVRALGADARCAYDLSGNDMPYRGLRGRGVAVCHAERGEEMLKTLLLRYLGSLELPLSKRLLRRAATEVAIEIVPSWQSDWDFTARMQGSVPRDAG